MSKLYQEAEPSIIRHGKNRYHLNILLRIAHASDEERVGAHSKQDLIIEVKEFEWLLIEEQLDEKRVALADTKYPILITDWRDTYVILDGIHRLSKAVKSGIKTLNARYINPMELDSALVMT